MVRTVCRREASPSLTGPSVQVRLPPAGGGANLEKTGENCWQARPRRMPPRPAVPDATGCDDLLRKGASGFSVRIRDRYCVWAVNQRGYGRTTRPTQGVALPPDVLAVCTRQITEPGAATAMLNWYQAIRLRSSRTLNLAQVIDVPILVIWGERDVALDPSC